MMSRQAWQVLVIGLGSAVVPLDSSVNIAFPAITHGFGLAIADVQWVVISYTLTYTSLMLAFGRIGDMYGYARVFRVGLVWSAIACLLCALTRDFAWFVVCRVLQGVGAALVLSCGVALSTGLYGEERRSRVIGAYTMLIAVGSTLGPWLGGALVHAWDWPAVFWFRTPIALVALVLLGKFPATERPGGGERFDAPGAGLLVLAMIGLVLTLHHARDLAGLPLGLATLLVFAAFARREQRVDAPIIDLRVFRVPGFGLLNLANVLVNLAAFSVWLIVPYYLAQATDLGVTVGGAVLATAAVGVLVASPVGGRLIVRVPARRLALAGAALVAVGLLLIARWGERTAASSLVIALAVQGVGLGLFQLAYIDIVAATIARQSRGVAGSLAMVTRTIGVIGAASTFLPLFQRLAASDGFLAAFQYSFELAAMLALAVTALVGWGVRRA